MLECFFSICCCCDKMRQGEPLENMHQNERCHVCIPRNLDKNKTTTENEYHRARASEACLKRILSRVELYHKTCNEEECAYRTELTLKKRKQRRCGRIMAMAMINVKNRLLLLLSRCAYVFFFCF